MNEGHTNKLGFTLVELSTAASITVIAVTIAMGALVYGLRAAGQSQIQNELDIDVQKSMERLKHDIRLSSLDEMFFYPAGSGPYSAISFPMARDDDGDQAVDLDEDGYIIWDRTLIYHVWPSEPHQLRLTTFDPRDSSLTEAQRQEQINSVVANGTGSLTHNGANASTRVVFENLFTWTITPRGSTYDGYASELSRDIDVVLGSCVLDNGSHTFTFTVSGKNPNSTGYQIGIDSLVVSPSYGVREAEAQLPATDQSGAVPVSQYMEGGSWNGNYQLLFPATAAGQYFTLTMENDRWEETNFRATGETHEDTTVSFDQSGSPYDFVVHLHGFVTNWHACQQTGDTNSTTTSYDLLRDCAVRVLLRGEEMVNGNWIECNGGKCAVNFRAGSQPLKIEHAYIAECASSVTNTMDAAGTGLRLTFSGANWVSIVGGANQWSDPLDFPIDREKSYLVSFLAGEGNKGTAWQWNESIDPGFRACYVIPATNSPTEADISNAVWSTRGEVQATNCVYAVQYLFTTYPTNGSYTSRIFDTHLDDPDYSEIDWNEDVPSGSDLRVKVRSGNTNDLTDAVAWSNISAMVSPGIIDPGDKRYVQFQAELEPVSSGLSTPKLKDVTIKWTGEQHLVDIGATFTKGPDGGIFILKVDGETLKAGVKIDLEIFNDTLGFRGTRRITSALSTEITPRNTGK